jgi:predicted nucleic acid-binding protein
VEIVKYKKIMIRISGKPKMTTKERLWHFRKTLHVDQATEMKENLAKVFKLLFYLSAFDPILIYAAQIMDSVVLSVIYREEARGLILEDSKSEIRSCGCEIVIGPWRHRLPWQHWFRRTETFGS